MYCILTKYTVDDPMLKSAVAIYYFVGGFTAATKKIRQIKTFGGG